MKIIQTVTYAVALAAVVSCSEESGKSEVSEKLKEKISEDVEANKKVTEEIKDRPEIDGTFRR